jgi:hypothetical protein
MELDFDIDDSVDEETEHLSNDSTGCAALHLNILIKGAFDM